MECIERKTDQKSHRPHFRSMKCSIFAKWRVFASGSGDKTIVVWRISSEKRTKTLKIHHSVVYNIVFSPNGEYLASGSDDDIIRVWRVSSRQLIKIFTGHSNAVYSVVFSPNGEYLAFGSEDNTIGEYRAKNALKYSQATLMHLQCNFFHQTESIWPLDLMMKKSMCGGCRAEHPSKYSQPLLICF